MSFNVIDIAIVFLLFFGFLNGFKRGFIKQAVITIGTIIVIILAFLFKNPLSMVLYKHLPFYTVGLLKNYSSLNILLYELISFFILLSLFSLIFAVIVKISGLVEKIVRATIILALPSKILGGILGVIETYNFCFIVLLIITMPIFMFSTEPIITESKLKDKILNNTIIISDMSKGLVKSIDKVNDLLMSKKQLGKKEFNCKTINVFVKNKVVSKKSVKYLQDNNKIDKECVIK